jgi:predicted Rossmann fold flavoprotein
MLKKEKYDVAVIGAGPAGMMAAGRAGELGMKVVLVERNENLGKKLLLTGRGRCNLTHAELDPKKFADAFGRQGRFLLSGLSVFGVGKTIKFFESMGLKLKEERNKKIFPKSDRSQDVLKVLTDYLKKGGVKILKGRKVKKIVNEKGQITSLILKNKKEIKADKYIFATGGKSYFQTGSTGNGYSWAEEMGHKIIELKPALAPLKIKEEWVKRAQGLSLKNVEISVYQNNKKKDKRFGGVLFTHFGISGPIVLEMSKNIGQLLSKGEVKLKIDLKPALNSEKLDKRIQRDFLKYQNKMFKNSLNDLLPQKLIPIIIRLLGINPEKEVNNITRQERQKLIGTLKGLEMTVDDLMGFDMAIITSGGIALAEIDSSTMKSKIIDNLYFAGEIIDLDGPTGGYNLQFCWTTGYVAGQSASNRP